MLWLSKILEMTYNLQFGMEGVPDKQPVDNTKTDPIELCFFFPSYRCYSAATVSPAWLFLGSVLRGTILNLHSRSSSIQVRRRYLSLPALISSSAHGQPRTTGTSGVFICICISITSDVVCLCSQKVYTLCLGLFRLEIKIFWVSHRMCRKDIGRGF